MDGRARAEELPGVGIEKAVFELDAHPIPSISAGIPQETAKTPGRENAIVAIA
jgi:hypothetical protein